LLSSFLMLLLFATNIQNINLTLIMYLNLEAVRENEVNREDKHRVMGTINTTTTTTAATTCIH